MAGGQERILRRRIRSVQSTMKITRAMELIAASRIVRAQQAIAAARPYVEKMAEVVSHLADTPDAAAHPLFRTVDSVQRAAIIVITADRGLCGGYNSMVLRAAEGVIRDHAAAGHELMIVDVGRKGESYFRYRNRPVVAAVTGITENPTFDDARQVVAAVMEPFSAGEVDSIQLVYTRFISFGSQAVTVRQLVPLDPDARRRGGAAMNGSGPADTGAGGSAGAAAGRVGSQAHEFKTDYEFEPDPTEILDRLLPNWLEGEILAAMLEAAASQQAARQRAMKAATDNADELITSLRRVMNRARQDSITTEITEIVGGAEAMRQAGAGDGSGAYNQHFEPPAARSA